MSPEGLSVAKGYQERRYRIIVRRRGLRQAGRYYRIAVSSVFGARPIKVNKCSVLLRDEKALAQDGQNLKRDFVKALEKEVGAV